MEEYIKWECIVCGLIYDEAEGWPEDGIRDCLLSRGLGDVYKRQNYNY